MGLAQGPPLKSQSVVPYLLRQMYEFEMYVQIILFLASLGSCCTLKVLTMVTLQNEHDLTKMSIFRAVALDNRIRFCDATNTTCALHNLRLPMHAKLSKMEVISSELFLESLAPEPQQIVWLDADALITAPTHNMATVMHCQDGGDLGLAHDYQHNSKFNSGVMFLCPTEKTAQFVSRVVQRMSQQKKGSDQRVVNRLISSRAVPDLRVVVLDRVKINAFPSIAHSAQEWAAMQLPAGDQDIETKIVHFAGQFGGGDLTTGKEEEGVLLLSTIEFLQCHLTFLRLLAPKPLKQTIQFRLANAPEGLHCVAVSRDRAVRIVDEAAQALKVCAKQVSSVFDDILREIQSKNCLRIAKNSIEQLWRCSRMKELP